MTLTYIDISIDVRCRPLTECRLDCQRWSSKKCRASASEIPTLTTPERRRDILNWRSRQMLYCFAADVDEPISHQLSFLRKDTLQAFKERRRVVKKLNLEGGRSSSHTAVYANLAIRRISGLEKGIYGYLAFQKISVDNKHCSTLE